MADTKTSSKITKKDLEAQVVELSGEIGTMREIEKAYGAQVDDYYQALTRANSTLDDYAKIVSGKDRMIYDLESNRREMIDTINSLQEINDELDGTLSVRLRQINFLLRVAQSIASYGGTNADIPRQLAEAVLSEAEMD